MKTVNWGVLFYLLLLAACNPYTDMAGNSTNEGNAQITGMVTDRQGKAVSNASVSLHKYSEVGDVSKQTARTVTDTAGGYVFEQVTFGNYGILAVSEDSSLVQLTTDHDITPEYDRHEIGALRLDSSASIFVSPGISPANIDSTVVRLHKSPWQQSSAGTGDVSLPLLAEGHYGMVVSMHYHAWGKPFSSVIYADTLTLQPSQAVKLDSVVPVRYARESVSVVFDDFEDGNLIPPDLGLWSVFGPEDQLFLPDSSIRKASEGGAAGSRYSLQVLWDGFTGEVIGHIRTHLKSRLSDLKIEVFQSYDLSNLDSISFDAKGGPVRVTPEFYLFHEEFGALMDTVVVASKDWKRHVVRVEKPGETNGALLRNKLKFVDKIGFILSPYPAGQTGYTGTLRLDNIELHF